MVEGKADDRANDPEVMAKKAVGFEWARFANDSGDAPDTWHYLFATETAICCRTGPIRIGASFPVSMWGPDDGTTEVGGRQGEGRG